MQRIFVGDVQGCSEEFAELLDRASTRFGRGFELWIVGDLVNRGPENLAPLRRVRELVEAGRARYILGNHELTLLRCWLGLKEPTPFDSFGDVLAAPDADEWMEWLAQRPVVETGQLGEQPFAMVHAGVHPDWSLEELECVARELEGRLRGSKSGLRRFLAASPPSPEDGLGRLTRCREVGPGDAWSSNLPEPGRSRAWHEAWSERGHGYGLVYGHWALQGLHAAPWLRGLDTGCVHHGRGRDGTLTAWLPDPRAARPFDVPDDRFWQIPARRAYYAHRDAASG